jgi:8-oxo-dGTP diphosphatase
MKNKNKLTRASQKAIILNKRGKILTIRRTKTAPSWPLSWDLPGGRLDFGEDTKVGVVREIKEETGLKIRDLNLLDTCSEVNVKGEFWVKICYTARAATTKVKLSFEHDDFMWVTPREFLALKASPLNKKFIRRFVSLKKIIYA